MYSSEKTIAYTHARNTYMVGVFRYMTLGLFVTAIIAYFSAQSITFIQALSNSLFFLLLVGFEIGLVVYLSTRIARFSTAKAISIFLLYSALNGLTIAPIFLAYTHSSIVSTFFICSAMFATMSLYGTITKRDLTSLGSFLTMGLFGIIIATLINLFLKNSALASAINYIGVFLFLGLTAFDVQKLKEMGATMPLDNATVANRGMILGALTLYLDFINLFLFLLRIFGDRNE